MSFHDNDAFNKKLYDVVFTAQISHEMNGTPRRELIRRARNESLGQLRKIMEKLLRLDDAEMERFFETVCREYGV